MYENIFRPAKFSGYPNIKLPLQIVFTFAHDNKVFGPANFSNHWLEFLIVPVI
jgi:hypothetical protein